MTVLLEYIDLYIFHHNYNITYLNNFQVCIFLYTTVMIVRDPTIYVRPMYACYFMRYMPFIFTLLSL